QWNVRRMTAARIYTKARTTNGYYGGSWAGPADGSASAWVGIGSTPQQIMTSASSVNMIVAAGFLESRSSIVAGPVLSISRGSGMAKLSIAGEKAWTYELQSSLDLTTCSQTVSFSSL